MGSPAATLRRLSERLGKWGERLARGQIILTGSALPLFPVETDCQVVVETRPLGDLTP